LVFIDSIFLSLYLTGSRIDVSTLTSV